MRVIAKLLAAQLILGLATAGQAETMSQEDIDYQIYLENFHIQELEMGYSVGAEAGRANFQNMFDLADCASIFLGTQRVTDFSNWAQYSSSQAAIGQYYTHGYYAGLITGFRLAYKENFRGCEKELNGNLRESLEAKRKTCTTIASQAVESMTLLQDFSLSRSHGGANVEASKLMDLILLGESNEAWSRIMGMDRELIESLPCQIAVLDTIESAISARIRK